MTLDEEIKKIMQNYPSLHNNLDLYEKTGHRSYEQKIIIDLKYANRYFDRFACEILEQRYLHIKEGLKRD